MQCLFAARGGLVRGRVTAYRPDSDRAVAICQPPPDLLVQTDRGSQYTREAFTTLLERTQTIAHLSRPGNPYDNALSESSLRTLKTELLHRGACFADLEEARLELTEYLDHYYHTQGLHAVLDYCIPPRSRIALSLQPTLAQCPFASDHINCRF